MDQVIEGGDGEQATVAGQLADLRLPFLPRGAIGRAAARAASSVMEMPSALAASASLRALMLATNTRTGMCSQRWGRSARAWALMIPP